MDMDKEVPGVRIKDADPTMMISDFEMSSTILLNNYQYSSYHDKMKIWIASNQSSCRHVAI